MLELLKEAIKNRNLMLLRTEEDSVDRKIEPHIIYEASNGNILVDFYQLSGYSSSGNLPCWKRMKIKEIANMVLLKDHFNVRFAEGYNPSNRTRYAKIISQV